MGWLKLAHVLRAYPRSRKFSNFAMKTLFIHHMEAWIFSRRKLVLGVLIAFTMVMGYFLLQMKLDVSFEKHIPAKHEFIQTFLEYREQLSGANRVVVAIHARKGDIWSPKALEKVLRVTEDVTFLKGINRNSVTSLWTPNVFYTEITEEGFSAEPIIGGDVTLDSLTAETTEKIKKRVVAGGYVGSLVARDHTSALVVAEIHSENPATQQRVDFIELGKALEQLRQKHEDEHVEIQILGFAKEMGDIAEKGGDVLQYVLLAMTLTAAAVYWYCHSIRLTLLTIACSLVSIVWQFGTLSLMGYGLDPFAMLMPFLVFSIGVSHGIQQIHAITREIAAGKSTEEASRTAFRVLLIPGILALLTALVSFVSLVLIPVPAVQELGIAAAVGISYKIVTNLILLPLVVSFCSFSRTFAEHSLASHETRGGWAHRLAILAQGRTVYLTLSIGLAVFALALWQSEDRQVGSLQPGSTVLRPDARYNQDALAIASKFDLGLDWVTVVFEVQASAGQPACSRVDALLFIDELQARLSRLPGVVSSESITDHLKAYNAGVNEGYSKMATLTRDPRGLANQIQAINNRTRGLVTSDCGVVAVNLFLSDHRATTLTRLVQEMRREIAESDVKGVKVRLAGGNAGVEAAVNDVIAAAEKPMLVNVYVAIALLVLVVYRDWRAVLACCLPLTLATFIGYWFMTTLEIGLTVATLPVMVLAVGIGVDYSFYIYSRLEKHLAEGTNIYIAVAHSLRETGVATLFTAVTLSVGVASWSVSELQFQADMGMLLAFMFLINMIVSLTLLPALVVVLHRWFSSKNRRSAAGIAAHH